MHRHPLLRSSALRLTALSLSALVPSCQRYAPAPLNASSSLESYRTTSLNSPEIAQALRKANLAPSGSWDVPKLAAAAEGSNLTIRRTRADWEATRAAIEMAGTKPPVGVSLDLQHASNSLLPWTYGFLLDYTFETGGKKTARLMKARVDADAAALEIAKARWDVRTAISLAYVDRLAAESRSKTLANASVALAAWEEAVKHIADAGQTGRFEELTLNRERAILERDSAEAAKQIRTADAALAQAMGLRTMELASVSLKHLPASPPPPPSLDSLQRNAALGRPDVLSKLAAYAVSEAALRIEVTNQYPDLRLGPGYSYDQGQHKWLLSPGTSILPDLNRAGLAQAEAARKAAAAAFLEAQNLALGEVSTAWTEYSGSLGQVQKAESLEQKSIGVAAGQQSLVDGGVGNRADLLQVRYQAAQDQVAVDAAKFQAWRALVLLQDATRYRWNGSNF